MFHSLFGLRFSPQRLLTLLDRPEALEKGKQAPFRPFPCAKLTTYGGDGTVTPLVMVSQPRLGNTRLEHLLNYIGYHPVGTDPTMPGITDSRCCLHECSGGCRRAACTFLPDTCRKGVGSP